MLRSMLRGVMLFTLLTLPPAVMADKTYYLQNNPAYQNGWTLSGTITTDGTIGTIQATNVLSWTWTITGGGNSYTLTSTDPGAGMGFNGITATQTGLYEPIPDYGGINLFGPSGGGMGMVRWIAISQYQLYTEGLTQPPGNPPIPGWSSMETAAPGSTAWLIASASPVAVPEALTSPVAVPEPSSLYIVGFGAVCVYVMGHKRRARRTATTEG